MAARFAGIDPRRPKLSRLFAQRFEGEPFAARRAAPEGGRLIEPKRVFNDTSLHPPAFWLGFKQTAACRHSSDAFRRLAPELFCPFR